MTNSGVFSGYGLVNGSQYEKGQRAHSTRAPVDTGMPENWHLAPVLMSGLGLSVCFLFAQLAPNPLYRTIVRAELSISGMIL